MSAGAAGLAVVGTPFLAGVLVTLTHVPLGREVLRRGIIFIDLAIAQLAAAGVILAQLLGLEAGGWVTQAIAAGSALLGALLMHVFETRWPDIQEALIGVTFVLAASVGMLLLAGNPHGAEHLSDLLAGQLLWVDSGRLLNTALLYAPLLLLWFTLGPGRLRFYLVFALAVTASVQLIGVYLVFSALIIPALAVRHLPSGLALAAGYALGMAAFALGLACSLWLDWPAGPAVVCMLALLGSGCAMLPGWRRHAAAVQGDG